ncbi:MAG: hypothetical protein F6K41_36645 [Symploca sp. SIO3E6]|nr:hypothetical protein [Caldora sp. SIO3E6]
MKWHFVKLDNSIQKAQFDCGIPQLNDYLKKYALQNDKKGVAKVIIAIPAQGERVVAGYYTVSMSLIERESIVGKSIVKYRQTEFHFRNSFHFHFERLILLG